MVAGSEGKRYSMDDTATIAAPDKNNTCVDQLSGDYCDTKSSGTLKNLFGEKKMRILEQTKKKFSFGFQKHVHVFTFFKTADF